MTSTAKRVRASGWALLVVLALLAGGCKDSGVEALVKGDRLLRQNAYEQALEEIQTAVRLMPNNAQAWNRLGLAYHGLQQPQQALKAYEKARHLDHKSADVQFNLGCLLVDMAKHELAEQELTSFTMQQPAMIQGWLWLGRAQLRASNYDAAERSFKTLLELDPHHVEALNNLGVLQVHRKRYAEAMQIFAQVLSRNPNYSPALFNIAVVNYDHLKNRSLARIRLAEYLESIPSSSHSPQILAWQKSLEPVTRLASARSPSTSAQTVAPGSRQTNATSPPPILQPYRPQPKPAPKSDVPPVPPPKPTPPTDSTSIKATNVPPTNVVAKSAPTTPPNQPKSEPAPTARTQTPAKTFTRPAPPEKSVPPPQPKPAVAPPIPTVRVEGDMPVTAPNEVESASAEVPAINLGNTPVMPGTSKNATTPTTLVARARSDPSRTQVRAPSKADTRYKYRQPKPMPAGDRNQAEILLREGLQWHRSGRQSYAIERYQAAVLADPAYFEAYFNMAVAAFEIADWPQALVSYESALALKPDSADAHFNFCMALQKANYPTDTLNELNRLLKRHPDMAKAHLALANVYANTMRNPKKARPHYQKVIELEPQHPEGDRIRTWLTTNR